MTSGKDNPIRDFIAANWVRYTRETITQQLIEAGYDRTHIDEAWEEVVAADSVPPMPPRQGDRQGITVYVISSFVIGLLAMLIPMSLNFRSQDIKFDAVFIVGYIVIGGVAGYLITRFRVVGAWWVLAGPLVPILYAVVWFGTCIAAYRSL